MINPDAYFSGPVYIPHLYNGKNKTFFFYGFQMMIEKQGKQLDGHCSHAGHAGRRFHLCWKRSHPQRDLRSRDHQPDPNGVWARSPFPGNIIPQSRFSNVAKAFLAMNPIAPPDVAGNWTNTGPSNNVQLGR